MKSFTHLKHHNTYSHMSKKCVCDHSLPPHFTNLTPPPFHPTILGLFTSKLLQCSSSKAFNLVEKNFHVKSP